jgi:tRNA G18 (ribose-2'-O)-methylase SpoU
MGGIFALSVYRTENLAETLTEIKHVRPSMRTIALETSIGAHLLDSYPIPHESMMLFGSEGTGIAAEVLAACDAVVQIPMQPLPAFDAVNSLNVAASTAVVLYHLANGASA